MTDLGRPRKGDDAPVAGADVVLSNALRTFTTNSTATGDFSFEGIPAGDYSLSARLAPYISNPAALPVEVPAVGCVERFPRLEAAPVFQES
ncbi:MAG: carboxypeptidase-like regulatory domain-containing protein [Acidobacteriota bacterium]